MFDRKLVLRFALVILPLILAGAVASLFRRSESPSLFVLVLATVVGSMILVVMRGDSS
jgi:hypothetical protein